MNSENIKDIIEQAGSGALEQKTERRGMLKTFGAKVAAISLPILASSYFNKAKAQTTENIIAALNDALLMEFINAEFYKQAMAAEGLMNDALKPQFAKIGADDEAHSVLIRIVIDNLGGEPMAAPSGYDFTGGKGNGGPYPNVFTDYEEFLQVAQILKDTTLRRYKSLLGTFIPENDMVTTIINIHSVEARHSAHIRSMRYNPPILPIKPWITSSNSYLSDPFGIPVYANEDNILQAGINMTDVNGYKIRVNTATEAFDEALTKEAAMAIFNKFIL